MDGWVGAGKLVRDGWRWMGQLDGWIGDSETATEASRHPDRDTETPDLGSLVELQRGLGSQKQRQREFDRETEAEVRVSVSALTTKRQRHPCQKVGVSLKGSLWFWRFQNLPQCLSGPLGESTENHRAR